MSISSMLVLLTQSNVATYSLTGVDYAIIGIVVLLFGFVGYMGYAQFRDKNMSKAEKAARTERRVARYYGFLHTFFLTQSRVVYISSAISSLSIYKPAQIQLLVVKLYTVSTAMQLMTLGIGIFIFRDIFAIMACVIIILVMSHVTVNLEIEKINLKVYKEMSNLLSSVRQEYLRTNSIPEALVNITPTMLMAKPVAQLEDILTSSKGEEKLMKFYESSPFRMLQTFATVCYNINNTGDEIDKVTGQSKFLDSLTLMASDVNSEVHRLTLIRSKFMGLAYITLSPLLVTPVAKLFLSNSMPGTVVIFDGPLGFVVDFLVLLSVGLMFYLVANMSMSKPITDDDRIPQLVSLYERSPRLRRFLFKVSPKNAKRRRAIHRQTEALSMKTPELFTLEKLVMGGAGLVVGVVLLFLSLSAGKAFLEQNIENLGIVPDTSLEAYDKEVILEMDNRYLTRTGNMNDEEIFTLVKNTLPDLTDLDIGEQVKRLKDKEKALDGVRFKWWHMLLVYAFTLGISYIPNLLLRMRTWSAKVAAEDDFLQLQSLMAVIVCMEVDTLDALELLSTNTRIHRPMLLYAYHSYPSDPEKELDRLASRVNLVNFKRFITKFKLTISELSLGEAFSDLLIEREHMVRMREISMIDTIERKRNLAGLLAQIPLGMTVFLHVIVPIAYLGYQQFSGAMSGLNNL